MVTEDATRRTRIAASLLWSPGGRRPSPRTSLAGAITCLVAVFALAVRHLHRLGEADAASVVRVAREQRADVLMIEELTPSADARLDATGLNQQFPYHLAVAEGPGHGRPRSPPAPQLWPDQIIAPRRGRSHLTGRRGANIHSLWTGGRPRARRTISAGQPSSAPR